MTPDSIKLVAFDLDGTLLRGDTVCEVIARGLGKLDQMREFEKHTTCEEGTAGRREITKWYDAVDNATLLSYLSNATVAPGVTEAFDLLRQAGTKIAIVSLTWGFAVQWFAEQFGADVWVGTKYVPRGQVVHFWPEDKPRVVKKIADTLGIGMVQIAPVGDSSGDVPMLRAAGRSVFVGGGPPNGFVPDIHEPDGDIFRIVQELADPAYTSA